MSSKNFRDVLRAENESRLLYSLDTTPPDLQAKISTELGRRRSKAAVDALKRRLKSVEPAVREAAAEALGKIGDSSVGGDLLQLFADRQQPASIRDTSAYALGRLAYRPAVSELLSALADPSASVRNCAVAALAAIGDVTARGRIQLAWAVEQEPKVRNSMKLALTSLSKASSPKVLHGGVFVFAYGIAARELRQPLRVSSPFVHTWTRRKGSPYAHRDLVPSNVVLNWRRAESQPMRTDALEEMDPTSLIALLMTRQRDDRVSQQVPQ